MGKPTYATVEQLQAATDFKTTAYETDRLRRHLRAASRKIEDRLLRHFYPLTEARTYISPSFHVPKTATSSGFFLNSDLLSLTSVVADGDTLTLADVELWPKPWGPPYSWIGATGSEIVVTGVWGYTEDTEPAGALAEELDASETDVDVTDSSAMGIGDLLLVGSERMIVEARTHIDTTQNLGVDLAANVADNSVNVGSGSAFTVGEEILIGSERMLIVDISGNLATVKREWNGSTLAAHTSPADIYAPRRLTVEREAVGTTAAGHSNGASISRHVPPDQITELCLAEALVEYAQQTSGYGRTVGSGDNQREARGVGLADARKHARRLRRSRVGAV